MPWQIATATKQPSLPHLANRSATTIHKQIVATEHNLYTWAQFCQSTFQVIVRTMSNSANTNASQIDTLYQLLEASNTQFKVYDMGRRVQKLSHQEFIAFEDASQAYPYPLQQKAWFAILFWDKDRSSQQFLWLLNFQLDEQGKLVQATRNHFMAMVLEVLGTELTQQNSNQEKLDNNPYTFKPEQNKLAMLNAKIKVDLKQPASVYFEHAHSYLKGEQGFDNWQSVAIQGLADFAARLHQKDHTAILNQALPSLPQAVFTPLASMLEHVEISTHTCEQLLKMAERAIEQNDKAHLINIIRAISCSKATALRQQLLKQIFSNEQMLNSDLLMVITARCWLDLTDDNLRALFLESLAKVSETIGSDHQLFVGIVSDLVAIPATRRQFLLSFRNTERSDCLAQAIGVLFNPQQT